MLFQIDKYFFVFSHQLFLSFNNTVYEKGRLRLLAEKSFPSEEIIE